MAISYADFYPDGSETSTKFHLDQTTRKGSLFPFLRNSRVVNSITLTVLLKGSEGTKSKVTRSLTPISTVPPSLAWPSRKSDVSSHWHYVTDSPHKAFLFPSQRTLKKWPLPCAVSTGRCSLLKHNVLITTHVTFVESNTKPSRRSGSLHKASCVF